MSQKYLMYNKKLTSGQLTINYDLKGRTKHQKWTYDVR